MKTLNRLLSMSAAALVLASSSPAWAASGIQNGKVHTLRWHSGHTAVLIRMDVMPDHGGCGNNNYYLLPTSFFAFKEAYAMLLATHLADQPVELTISDCYEGYGRIVHVQSAR
jgi:hypothetical protein